MVKRERETFLHISQIRGTIKKFAVVLAFVCAFVFMLLSKSENVLIEKTSGTAGEIVSSVEFDLTAAERQAFEASVLLEEGKAQEAADKAYKAMAQAAKGLIRHYTFDTPEGDALVEDFKKRFYDTQLFFDKFAGGKFAQYFFMAHKKKDSPYTSESAHELIEEASLFIEAAHSCYVKMTEKKELV